MWKDHSPWRIYTNRIRDLHEFFLKLANMVWSLKKNPTENHEFPRFQLPFVGSLIWLFLLVWIQVFIPMAFLQYMEKYSMLMSTEIFLNSFEIFHICIRDWPEIGPRSVTVCMDKYNMDLWSWTLLGNPFAVLYHFKTLLIDN